MASLEQLAASPKLRSQLYAHKQTLDSALQQVFGLPSEENRIDKARRIMGVSIDQVANEDLEVYLTELQHLIDEWLDMFERQVFDGTTLKQLLGQG